VKLGIMQPYFFPYLGYFQLLVNCDLFIYFDIVKYNKKSWMARNRILNSNKLNQSQYINVPILKSDPKTLIKDVRINNSIAWKNKIIGQLTGYKRLGAPYYDDVKHLIENAFLSQADSLNELNITLIDIIVGYLGIEFSYKKASSIDMGAFEPKKPGDWALFISSKMKADEYINPYSGYEIFDESAFDEKAIKLSFLVPKLSPYRQVRGLPFVEAMSILDVLMFNSKSEVVDMLCNDFTSMGYQSTAKRWSKKV
jgi:hypothetical protein